MMTIVRAAFILRRRLHFFGTLAVLVIFNVGV
jgi:hypothetical protein